jgi:hypothetical protein
MAIALNKRKETSSFYESFSDLLFCTLVLFLVIIVGLIVQIGHETSKTKSKQDELDKKIEEAEKRYAEVKTQEEELINKVGQYKKDKERLQVETQELLIGQRTIEHVIREKTEEFEKLAIDAAKFAEEAERKRKDLEGTNRFTGSNGTSQLNALYLPGNPEKVYFYPQEQVHRFEIANYGETASEANARRRKALDRMIESTRTQRGLSLDEFDKLLSNISPYRGIGNQTQVVNVIFKGSFCNVLGSQMSSDFDISKSKAIWLKHSKSDEQGTPMQAPTLTVEVPDDEPKYLVVGGGVQLTIPELVALLEASYGTKISVETKLSDPDKLPKWFVDKVLLPTGYTNRMPEVPLLQ